MKCHKQQPNNIKKIWYQHSLTIMKKMEKRYLTGAKIETEYAQLYKN